MHELAIAQSIVEIASDAAVRAGADRVTSVEVVIGALGGGADEAVRTCFEIAGIGTPCEGAELRMVFEPVVVRCWDCGRESAVQAPLPELCPACGSARVQAHGGRSFRVESIEIPEEEPCASRS